MGGKTYHVLPMYLDKKEKKTLQVGLFIPGMYDIWTVWLRYLKKQDTYMYLINHT